MATPSKAFIDATKLSIMREPTFRIVDARLLAMFNTAAIAPNAFAPWWSVIVADQLAVAMIHKANRIPSPPLGRQMVLTFPPVYKERRAATGRLYPTGIR